jgi:hypothetical protein
MTFKTLARNTLFTPKPARHHLLHALATDALKFAWHLLTLHKVSYTSHLAALEFLQRQFPELLRTIDRLYQRELLPVTFPTRLYRVIDHALLELGGATDRGQRAFRVKKSRCFQNDGFFTLEIEHAPSVRVDDLYRYEANLEEAISRLGYANLRLASRPLRIEVDKAAAPTVTLASVWFKLHAKRNDLICIPAVTYTAKGLQQHPIRLVNDQATALIAGMSRSGKTQFGLAITLTLALLNSPRRLRIYLVDPKIMDFLPLNGLPHLARPIVNSAADALQLVIELNQEAERRLQRAKARDYSFLQEAIFLYVDELAEIHEQLSAKEQETFASHVQRLCQIGAGLGFLIVLATQRVYDVPKRLYGNLLNRFVLKTRDGSDSQAASGAPGALCHKLRGNGDCELYPARVRLQGLFVADPRRPDYIPILEGFVEDIKNAWQPAAVTEEMPAEELAQEEPAQIVPAAVLAAFEASAFDTGFLLSVYEEMLENGDISLNRILAIHTTLHGVGMHRDRQKAVKALVQSLINRVPSERGTAAGTS